MRITIIGAGLLGVTTAYFLARNGHQVTVVDRCEGPALETSFANGSMLTPSQAGPWNMPGLLSRLVRWTGSEGAPFLFSLRVLPSLFGWGTAFLYNSGISRYRVNLQKNARLAAYSMEILKRMREELDLHYDQSQAGTMKLYRNESDFSQALKLHELYKNVTIPVEVLDRQGVIRREPALSAARNEIAGGIFYPEDESGDAHQFCRQIAGHAQALGTQFRYNETVRGFARGGTLIKTIQTDTGSIEADIFIVAAGSYSRKLLRPLGISIPIQPVKGYSLTMDAAEGVARPVLPVVDESRHISIAPLGNRIRIGGSAEIRGYDTTIDKKRLEMIYRYFNELYPGLCGEHDPATANHWAGLRPYTCDGVPVIGGYRYENLFVNTGHGHLGWTMSAGSGKLLADLISHGKPELDLHPYRLERFD